MGRRIQRWHACWKRSAGRARTFGCGFRMAGERVEEADREVVRTTPGRSRGSQTKLPSILDAGRRNDHPSGDRANPLPTTSSDCQVVCPAYMAHGQAGS